MKTATVTKVERIPCMCSKDVTCYRCGARFEHSACSSPDIMHCPKCGTPQRVKSGTNDRRFTVSAARG